MANAFEAFCERIETMPEINFETINETARRYFARQWGECERDMADPALDHDEEAHQADLGLAEVSHIFGSGRAAETALCDLAAVFGKDLPPEGTMERRHARTVIMRAQGELLQLRTAMLNGDHVAPVDSMFSDLKPEHAGGPEMTLDEALAGWAAERQPPSNTMHEWTTVIRRFKEAVGDVPVRRITRQHVGQFKQAMMRYPTRPKDPLRKMTVPEVLAAVGDDPKVKRLSPKTVKQQLSALQSVLGWAVRSGEIETNPASGVTVAVPKVTKRVPYSEADMAVIFGSRIYAEGHRPHGMAAEAAYWFPLIAALTGARLGEIGQLLVSDVREEKGVPFLDVNEDEDDKSIKTHNRRKVPVHSELVRLGLLDYVEWRRQEGGPDAMLFPDLVPDTHGRLTANWSKSWRTWARGELGIENSKKTFHSFRHAFMDLAREAGLAGDVYQRIVGHADGSVSGGYGKGHSLAALSAAVEKIKLPVEMPGRWQVG